MIMDDFTYEEYVRRYSDMVYRIALSYTKNYYDAEDIFQNTFYKLLKYDKEFESDEHLKNWLIRVCVNEAKDITRSVWKNRVSSIDEMVLEPVYRSEETSEIYNFVMELKPKYRIVIYLHYYEGYSTKEIAKLIGSTDGTVRKRLERARKMLEELIE